MACARSLSAALVSVCAALGACSDDAAPPAAPAATSAPDGTATAAARAASPAAWLPTIRRRIAASAAAPTRDARGDLVAVNDVHGLRARFDRGAAITVATPDGADVGVLGLRAVAFGREGGPVTALSEAPAALGACAASGEIGADGACVRRVELAYDAGVGLVAWWESDGRGLEHGFDLAAAPPGDGPLVVDLAIDGAAVRLAGARAARLDLGGRELAYEGLVAHDATGEALDAWLEPRDGGLRIAVDLEGAAFPVTIDPLLTTPAWTWEPDVGGANAGFSVAGAGDVDGDGFDDVLVGAYGYQSSTVGGRAYLFRGSASGLATTPAWTGQVDQAGAMYGYAVSTAGDVDGDGYDDVLIGIRERTNPEEKEGAVFLYRGSPDGLGAAPAWVGEADAPLARFGYQLGAAGDVNGDGYSDVVIAAPNYDGTAYHDGAAFVYYGSPDGLSATWDWLFETGQADANIVGVGSAGDVDGDGYDDVIIGAYRYTEGEYQEGKVFVFHGSADGLGDPAAPDWTAQGDEVLADLGWDCETAGDVNGDGYSDVIVGAFDYGNFQTHTPPYGSAYLYLGSPDGLAATPAWAVRAPDLGMAAFGWSLASAGDVNGDGFADIVVGAPSANSSQGAAFVFLGSRAGLATTATRRLDGPAASTSYGYSVAGAGDVNGDGLSDVIVGAPYATDGESSEGRAYVYYGAPGGLTGAALREGGGVTLAFPGDVTGDGYGDLLVGSPAEGAGAGAVRLFPGSAAGPGDTAVWEAHGDAGDQLGAAVAGAGDVDDDGALDLLVGAPGRGGVGAALLFRGALGGPEAAPAWTAAGTRAGGRFGAALAGLGDVDGDGYGDVLVGGEADGAAGGGRAALYLGPPAGLGDAPAWALEARSPPIASAPPWPPPAT
ncbi:MAG: FG-GAP repeat protein [Deltaproteobacteria bacterium]|nr:FG-GAP repeat protein [Deltaproteobacteria bacterium]